MADDNVEVHWFKLLNNSGAGQNYVLFATPPDFNSRDFQTPIWLSQYVDNQGWWEVHTTAPIYAWAGRQYQEGERGKTRVQIEVTAKAHISDAESPATFSMSVNADGLPVLKETGCTSSTVGSFTVTTSSDFPSQDSNGNYYVFGFGKRNITTGGISPCASRVARPDDTVVVTPVIQLHFYNDASSKPGDNIDYEAITKGGKKTGLIDFKDHGVAKLCTVLHKKDDANSEPSWYTAYTQEPPSTRA